MPVVTNAEISENSDAPFLSVVVPVYNGAAFLPGCLASIAAALAQLSPAARADVEIIVCDNHSSDGTLALAQSADFPCVYRIVQPPEFFDNRTLNWHHGLSQAQGVWMMMLHADDLLAPGGLKAILRAARRQTHGSAVLLSGLIRTFSDETPPSRPKPFWPFPSLLSGEALRRRVLPFHCPFVPFTPMRRALYAQVGGLDARYELVQDWDLWIRMLAFGDVYAVPEEFGLWRQHGFSAKYATMFAQNHLELGVRLPALIPTLPPDVADDALDAQIVKVREWLPDAALESLTEGMPGRERIVSRPFPTREQAARAAQYYRQKMVTELYRLRLAGLGRLWAADSNPNPVPTDAS